MERLRQISEGKLQRVPMKFYRYLIEEIDWHDRLIGISGARGTGKTTLLLQVMKTKVPKDSEALYASLDDIFFAETPLVYFAEEFYKKGGNYLFLDEVHKYPNWSQELKNIYDNLPDLKVVFTSSSALDIYKGKFDLSRRVVVYNLPGLSFREFIELKYEIVFNRIELGELLTGKQQITWPILEKIKPLKHFEEYLKSGYYPFFNEGEQNYNYKLLNILNLVLENDLPTIFHIDFYSVMKIKKLLVVMSRIVPYKPNIQKLTEQSGTSRDTLLKFLYYLEKAEIVKWLTKDTFGINYLNKPEKLYLNNTNLMFALTNEKPNVGNIRETFFLNQVMVKHSVTYPEIGDFLVDGKFLFEVGGRNKSHRQIKGTGNAWIVADGIEFSAGNALPLWLFGFLY
jgi:uncharacterized protein